MGQNGMSIPIGKALANSDSLPKLMPQAIMLLALDADERLDQPLRQAITDVTQKSRANR